MKKALHQLSEGFSLASLIAPLLPLAFPAVALLDGAGKDYQFLSLVCLGFACCAVLPLCGLLTFLAEIADDIAEAPARREADARSLHAYLLNGGRV